MVYTDFFSSFFYKWESKKCLIHLQLDYKHFNKLVLEVK